MEILNNKFFLLALTFGVFFFAKSLQKRLGWVILNPILITISALIGFLIFFKIEYKTFSQAGQFIDFWLKPAIVALGVPLYEHLGEIRRDFLPIFLSQLVGCASGILSVIGIASALGASREVIISLAPKSVTTPIAMEICAVSGGIPSLTAAVVVCVGLLGAIFGMKILTFFKISDEFSAGLALGTASHAIGTSRAMERSENCGVYASLGLILNGILTAIFAPLILKLFGF